MDDHIFAPKIRYRMASMHINTGHKTPWQRLEDWEQADKGAIESVTAYITAKLQEQWPGNYRVELVKEYDRFGGWIRKHKLVFDDPAEETFFRLKYPK